MKWAEICVHTGNEAEEAVANILHETGANGVVIEDSALLQREWETMRDLSLEDVPRQGVVLKAYLPLNRSLDDIVDHIRKSVRKLKDYELDIGPGKVTVKEINSRDWETAWKKFYKPVRVSEWIVIKPSWETFESSNAEEIVIELDPGVACGTGTHPTTVLSLRALERTIRGGEQVMDIGCGSGILSIAAVKLGAAHALALDIDEIAVKATRENAIFNNVEHLVDVRQNDLLSSIAQTADVVVANILAEVIVRFVPDMAAVISPGGIFIASGIIKAKEQLVQQTLLEQHFVIVETFHQEGWVAITAQKR